MCRDYEAGSETETEREAKSEIKIIKKFENARVREREGRVPNVLMGHSRFLFLYFIFSTFNSKHMSGIKFCC